MCTHWWSAILAPADRARISRRSATRALGPRTVAHAPSFETPGSKFECPTSQISLCSFSVGVTRPSGISAASPKNTSFICSRRYWRASESIGVQTIAIDQDSPLWLPELEPCGRYAPSDTLTQFTRTWWQPQPGKILSELGSMNGSQSIPPVNAAGNIPATRVLDPQLEARSALV